ncbi:MAG: cyclic nucleotide-binding domain-containing protein, partial [Rhodospirillales bacterium]
QDKGLDAWLKDKGQPETLFAVTRLTREVFEPDRKLERLLALLEKVSTGQAFALVDGMIAEILDGAKALQGLLGPQRDNAGAWMTLAQLQRGKLPLKTPGPLAALNRALARDRFEETRSVLLERVSVGLAGVQPITKTGKADDKTAFQTLVKTLAEDVGISGGGAMAVAAHGRARSAFGTAEGDASAKDALIALMGLMPHKAAQLGLLLDLVTGGFETLPVLVAGFGHLLASVKRPKDLWPNDYDANVIKGAMIELRNKSEALQSQGEIGALIAQAMAKLAGDTEGETKAANAARAAAVVKKAPAKVVNRPVVRKKATDGAVIFEQGEAGETAYLIAEGTVEILIQTREGPRTIAKLGKGEVFGEMALIDNAPRMATAIAVGDCDLVTISRVDMAARLDRLEATDRVLRRLMDSFVHRLRNKA